MMVVSVRNMGGWLCPRRGHSDCSLVVCSFARVSAVFQRVQSVPRRAGRPVSGTAPLLEVAVPAQRVLAVREAVRDSSRRSSW